jgi:hypothetical protein
MIDGLAHAAYTTRILFNLLVAHIATAEEG